MAKSAIRINRLDNVAVALRPIGKGEKIDIDGEMLEVLEPIVLGHKIALCDIASGDDVIKYGYPIGHATSDIPRGRHVHTHNLRTGLSESADYRFSEEALERSRRKFEEFRKNVSELTFRGYERKDGRAGIRNALWIVPTVGCVNEISRKLASWADEALGIEDGVHAWTHPFGCSQLGDDHELTRTILADLVHHPNAGGVLVIGLGCENNTMAGFKEKVGPVDGKRVRFMVCQEEDDEIEKGKVLLREIAAEMKNDRRTTLPLSRLVCGMKCGGSDGLSGITANALVGRFTDELVARDGTAILTEVPEMFGAEQVLLDRTADRKVYDEAVAMINAFKHYFVSHGQVVYENPSPGNKNGGITTLEDKSLGCVQKGGMSPIRGILKSGDRVDRNGINLLSGPGNDIVSTTLQSAAGANLILFTTGRGTPLGAPVPTIKISSNTPLYEKKGDWIDFNAGRLLEEDADKVVSDFLHYVIKVANGEEKTNNEKNGYMEISIFKDGVTL